MSQVALAQDLGISRTPLREALRMLQSEGLVEGEPNRRVRVAPMTAADLEELYVMRITLEAEALRLSVPRMTSEDLARLEGHMAEMAHYAAEKDYRRWNLPHEQFHRGADRARRRAGQLRARADVRPRRALPPAAHRPRPDRVGDGRAPRDPRCLQGRRPGRERGPAGLASGAGPGSRSPSCSTRITARSCSSWRWPTPAALRRTRVGRRKAR